MKRNIDLLDVPPEQLKNFEKEASFLINEMIPGDKHHLQNSKNEFAFRALVFSCVGVAGDATLGLSSIDDGRKHAELGVATGLDYFSGEWTKDVTATKNDALCILKEPSNTELLWWDVFPQALLMAFLLENDHAITALCNWVECWMERGFDPASPYDPSIVKIYISVASAFRTTPLETLAAMEEDLAKIRAKHPRLLFKAWSAARSGDATAFEKHFSESLKQFEKLAPPPQNSTDLLALNESLVLAAACKLGMATPQLEPKLLARLITRESLVADKPARKSKR